MELVSVNSVSKKFFLPNTNNRRSELWALKDVSFTVNKGDFVALRGLNGSGKTTLLRIIAGIMPPTHGHILTRCNIMPIISLGATFINEFSAKENIYIFGALIGLSRKQMNKQLEQMVEFADLEKFIDTDLRVFSTGMCARLALSTCLHIRRDLYLIDDVISITDAEFQQKCLKKLKELTLNGSACIIVNQRFDRIEKLCTKVVELRNGHSYSYENLCDISLAKL